MVIFVLIFSTNITTFAAESTIPYEYEELISELPDDIKDLLPDGIFSDSAEDIIDSVKEMSSWEYIINFIFDLFGLNFRDLIKALSIILSTLILSSLINAIKKLINNNSTSKLLDMISSAMLVIVLINLSKEPIERTTMLLDNIRLFVNTLSPLITTMFAMGGNVSMALINNYGMIVFLTIFENVSILALEMILGVCLSLTVASAFIGDGSLIPLSSAIKKWFTFFVGIIMLVFTTVISAQSLLASKSDTLSSKTAKMLAAQMIPVVGGSIGESLRTAGASIEYLRSNVGIMLVIILAILILPTLISIFLYRMVFIFSNGVAGLLGCGKEGGVLMEISSIYGYALAILSISAISLLFLITIFAKSTSPMT